MRKLPQVKAKSTKKAQLTPRQAVEYANKVREARKLGSRCK